MDKPEKKGKKQNTLLKPDRILRCIFLVIIVFFLILITVLCARGLSARSKKIFNLNEGWYTQEGAAITLPLKRNPSEEQPLSIWCELPADFDLSYTICFRSSHQEVTVRLDGETLYSYQVSDDQLLSRSAPSRWNFISIPEGSGGAVLEIEKHTPYKAYSGAFNQIYYGSSNNVYNMVCERAMPALLLSVLLLTMGIFLTAVYFLSNRLIKIPSIFWLGMFLILFGVWSLLEARPMSWPEGFDRYVTTLTCWSFMLVPIPFVFYLRQDSDRKSQLGLSVLSVLALLNILVCNLLQLAGIRDLMEMIGCTRMLLVIMVVYGCVRVILLFQSKDNPNRRIRMLGAVILYGSAALELLLYYSTNYNYVGTVMRFGVLIFAFALSMETVKGIVKNMRENAEIQEQLQKSKVQLMIRQMQPHFLFNSLHAIQALCYSNPREAANAIVLFSNYLRANMNCLDNDGVISSDKELEYIENYIRIQKMCFGDELIFIKNWTARRFLIPPLTIQPFVENAIRHGIRKRKGAGTVVLTSCDRIGETVVTIEDNGVGYDVNAPLPEKGFHSTGNVRFRLETLVDAAVEVESEKGRGTRVTIRIPRQKRGGQHESYSCG